jgi:phage terminase large subunit-like protein
VWVEIPRKNAKSATIAMIVIAHMLTTENPQVIIVAANREQAAQLFGYIYNMIQLSPELRTHLEAYRRVIRLKNRIGEAKVISSDGKSNLGLNPSLICADEILAWSETRGPELYEALTTSMVARDSQMIFLTTAGDSYSFGWKLSQHARKVARGEVVDPKMYAVIYAADETDDPLSEETWRKANPSYGVTVRPDYFEEVAARAAMDDQVMASFKKLHLNIWAGAGLTWVEPYEWQKMTAPTPDLDGWSTYIGVDLASVNDFTAYAIIHKHPTKRRYHVEMRFQITTHGWQKRRNLYPDLTRQWVKRGFISLVPGQVMTKEDRLDFLQDLVNEFKPDRMFFDPWNAAEIIEAMSQRHGEDFAMAVRQTPQFMSEPMKQVYSYAKGRPGFSHDGNEVMAWMVGNVNLITDGKDNWNFHKGKANEKIDGPVALFTGMAGILHTDDNKSAYNDIDFL